MVQRWMVHMVFSHYRLTSSVLPMLQQLQWPTPQERRAQAKIFMMYRILWNLMDIQRPQYAVPSAIFPRHHQNIEGPSPTSGQLPYSRQLRGAELAYVRLVLDDFNCAVYSCIMFMLNVPASLMCQYKNTPLWSVCTLLEEEEDPIWPWR